MKKIKFVIAKGLKVIFNPPALNACSIDSRAKICAKSDLTKCNIGRYSYVGYQNFIVNAKIGAFCSIADRCSIGGATHPLKYVSTSPVFTKGRNILKKNFYQHESIHTPQTVIESDVWLGQGVFVKAGVKISVGAVVGMNSVVTHDVGPYEIWAGNPARLIQKRFDDETITRLLETKWWEWNDEKIEKYAQYFDEPQKLFCALDADVQ